MQKTTIIYLLIAGWALAIVWSFWASGAIDGPRNLDTGFKRLDVFFKIQIIALMLAVSSAIFGFIFSRENKRLRIIGLIPVSITILAIAGIYLAAVVFNNASVSEPQLPTKPSTSVIDN